MVTPLASIIGSGFLVSVPLLSGVSVAIFVIWATDVVSIVALA